MVRNSSYLKVALFCVLALGLQWGIALGWYIDLTDSPWHTESSGEREYCVYNNTGERVFLYHDKTGGKYTLEPGEKGFPAHAGEKLKYHPHEIRCGFPDGRRQCVVRLAPFGYDPGLVLETAEQRQAGNEPSRRAGMPWAAEQSGELQPSEGQVRKASAMAPARTNGVNPPELLRQILERMVYVYHRERGEKKDRKLAELADVFDRHLAGTLPRETAAKLKEYETLCQCVHERAASGMSLDEIYREGLCGSRSTRDVRTEIVNDFARRVRRYSESPAM